MPFCFRMLNKRGRELSLKSLSLDPVGRFHLLTAPPLPALSLLASQTLTRGCKAEALSREEESNKSMGAGAQEPG